MPTINLGLNEALISVNKSQAQQPQAPIQVFHQINECFGCPLELLRTLNSSQENVENLILDTRYPMALHFRQSNSSLCHLDNLSLNSHGYYYVDLARGKQVGACDLVTVDTGDCALCPVAMLFCLVFVVTAIEKAVSLFARSKRQPKANKGTSTAGHSDSDLDERQTNDSQQEVLADDQHSNSEAPEQPAAGKSARRVESLDVLRGLTIGGMIAVNYGGAGYMQLEHKPWDGITLADFVFPFFIFTMGASIAMSLRASLLARNKSLACVFVAILRRSIILALVGLCLNSQWLDFTKVTNLDTLRLTGVLQRFAVSYLVVAVVYAVELRLCSGQQDDDGGRLKKFALTSLVVLIELATASLAIAVYIYFTFFFQYDHSCPLGYIGPGGATENGIHANCTGGAASWIDRQLLGPNHLYHDHNMAKVFKTNISHDPEGILGYSTSILLTLIGLQCGKLLATGTDGASHKQRLYSIGQWIILLTTSTSALVYVIPINKRLWSLSFVTVAALAAYLTLLVLYTCLDVYQIRKTFLVRVLISAGRNSLFLYVGHSLVQNMLPWSFPIADYSSHLQLLLRLTWATFCWLLIAHYMAKKRLYIRV